MDTDKYLFEKQIKLEESDHEYEIDVARKRFESALQDLINKGDLSESDHESIAEEKEKLVPGFEEMSFESSQNNCYSLLPNRPLKKKRRKEVEAKDSGFHHTYVMRMFDRSVDLAQFEESAPLYPICRAWILNQPHKLDQVTKSEFGSSFVDGNTEEKDCITENEETSVVVNVLPEPEPWPEDCLCLSSDPRIPAPPSPLLRKKLNRVNEELHISPALLLTEHLRRWRGIRNNWRAVGHEADMRYYKTFDILRLMFDGQNP